MPLLKFDLIEGRSEEQLRRLLDAAHSAVVSAFKVPMEDRYQVVTEHKRHQLVIHDTGLGIVRTDNLVVVTVVTSPRSEESKLNFYRELAVSLREQCQIESSDLMVSIVSNAKSDWSFGNGVAQYVTGEL